jgi:pimeloyl-ACP methyl ester carboxylesterase
MSATKTATLKVPGASLYYEVTGSGPLLLMIPGAPADAGAFAAIAGQRADRYTVVAYDWRGSSRSPLDEPPSDLPDGLPMQVQGDDAAQLLAALGAGPAYVLGCSGGALTGLDLAARHPEQVDTLVAHEPPAWNLLPEAAGWQAAFQQVHETYLRDGAGPAMQQFIATAVRTGGPTPQEDESGPPSQEQAPLPRCRTCHRCPPRCWPGWPGCRPTPSSSSPTCCRPPSTTSPTLPRCGRPRRASSSGPGRPPPVPHLAALALAERLGITPVGFPGDHQGFTTHPGQFAETVHKAAGPRMRFPY